MSNKIYIYNHEQANFYIQNGAICLGTGIHRRTRKPFWIFDWDSSQESYKLWCERKH